MYRKKSRRMHAEYQWLSFYGQITGNFFSCYCFAAFSRWSPRDFYYFVNHKLSVLFHWFKEAWVEFAYFSFHCRERGACKPSPTWPEYPGGQRRGAWEGTTWGACQGPLAHTQPQGCGLGQAVAGDVPGPKPWPHLPSPRLPRGAAVWHQPEAGRLQLHTRMLLEKTELPARIYWEMKSN